LEIEHETNNAHNNHGRNFFRDTTRKSLEVYDEVKPNELIACTIERGGKVRAAFASDNNGTKVIETFEAETENPIEMQRSGW
jgi:hypothetical protein